jgi:hypothetical protein
VFPYSWGKFYISCTDCYGDLHECSWFATVPRPPLKHSYLRMCKWTKFMSSGTYHCRRVVGCHGGYRWQLCACAKGSGERLILCFLRGPKIKQLLACTPTRFSTPFFTFHLDMCHHSLGRWLKPLYNAGAQELANRILPVCENYMVVSQFAEGRSHFKHGLTNHAFAAGLRAILQVSTCFRNFVKITCRCGGNCLPLVTERSCLHQVEEIDASSFL